MPKVGVTTPFARCQLQDPMRMGHLPKSAEDGIVIWAVDDNQKFQIAISLIEYRIDSSFDQSGILFISGHDDGYVRHSGSLKVGFEMMVAFG